MKKDEVESVLAKAPTLKPDRLIISDEKWRFLLWCVARGENTMIIGPSGFGKTLSAIKAAEALERDTFVFNMGATQDPRTMLVGTREADNGTTSFVRSRFVNAIQAENAVIVLDEMSRADREAWNILMPALDPQTADKRRYISLDEDRSRAQAEVVDGVTFIATANTGSQYTAARRIDRAIKDRFSIMEVDIPSIDDETTLLKHLFPSIDTLNIRRMCTALADVREMHSDNGGPLGDYVSTRAAVECCKMVRDGFTIREAFAFRVYTLFDRAGGESSHRTLVKDAVESIVPSYMGSGDGEPSDDNVPFGSKFFS